MEARVTIGSTRWCSTSSPRTSQPPSTRTSIIPPTGKIGTIEQNRMISMMPVQNTGAE